MKTYNSKRKCTLPLINQTQLWRSPNPSTLAIGQFQNVGKTINHFPMYFPLLSQPSKNAISHEFYCVMWDILPMPVPWRNFSRHKISWLYYIVGYLQVTFRQFHWKCATIYRNWLRKENHETNSLRMTTQITIIRQGVLRVFCNLNYKSMWKITMAVTCYIASSHAIPHLSWSAKQTKPLPSTKNLPSSKSPSLKRWPFMLVLVLTNENVTKLLDFWRTMAPREVETVTSSVPTMIAFLFMLFCAVTVKEVRLLSET